MGGIPNRVCQQRNERIPENKTKDEGDSLPLFMHFDTYYLVLFIYNYLLHTILSKYYLKKY